MDAVGFSSRLKRTHSDYPAAAAALAKSVDSRNNGGGGKRGKSVEGGRTQKSGGLRRLRLVKWAGELRTLRTLRNNKATEVPVIEQEWQNSS